MHIILSVPDDTVELTVTANGSYTETYYIDSIHYMREIFLRNVPGGDNFKEKYRVLEGPEALIQDLDLSVHVKNALLKAGIRTIPELSRRSRDSLLAIPGLGENSVDDIALALKKQGYDAHALSFPGCSLGEILEAMGDPDSVLNLDAEFGLRCKLYRAGIKKVAQLKALSTDDLVKIRGFQYSDFSKIVTMLETVHRRQL